MSVRSNPSLRGRRAFAASVVVLGLVAAACGDDSGSSSATTAGSASTTASTAAPATTAAAAATTAAATATTTATKAATGTPVKLGLAIALTGSKAAANKAVVDIMQGWVKMTNETGGVAGGHTVELVVKDSKGDAATMQSVVKELVETEKVAGLYLNDSQSEGSVADYLKASDVLVMGQEGYNTTEWGVIPNFVEYWLDIPGTIYASPYAAKTLGAKTFAAVSCAEVAACAQAEAIYKPASEGLGMTWAGLVTVAGADANYTAPCLTLIQKNVDFVILSVVSSVATRVMTDCLQQGYKGTFGSTAGGFEQYLIKNVKGAKVAGALHGFPWWVDAPAVKTYRDFLDKYAKGVEYRSGVHSNAYAGLELFKKAMSSQNLTAAVARADIFNGYYSLKDETLGGLLAQPFNLVKGSPAKKGICYWPYTYDTDKDAIALMATSGTSGNGQTGPLQSSCVTELKK